MKISFILINLRLEGCHIICHVQKIGFFAWISVRQEEIQESTLLRSLRGLFTTLTEAKAPWWLYHGCHSEWPGHYAEMSEPAGNPTVPVAFWNSNSTSQRHNQTDRCFSFSLYGEPETYEKHEKEITVQPNLNVQRQELSISIPIKSF